jgi:hypothetical protein
MVKKGKPTRNRADKEPGVSSRSDQSKAVEQDESEREPYRVRLPGFITEEDVGLGDVIKRVTYRVGIRPCTGCERRAAALNRWLVLSGSRPRRWGSPAW